MGSSITIGGKREAGTFTSSRRCIVRTTGAWAHGIELQGSQFWENMSYLPRFLYVEWIEAGCIIEKIWLIGPPFKCLGGVIILLDVGIVCIPL